MSTADDHNQEAAAGEPAGREDEAAVLAGPGIASTAPPLPPPPTPGEQAAGGQEGAPERIRQAASDAAATARTRVTEVAERARATATRAAQRVREVTESASGAAGRGGGEAPERASATSSGADAYQRRPELYAGAAFAGGLALARIIAALGGGDEGE